MKFIFRKYRIYLAALLVSSMIIACSESSPPVTSNTGQGSEEASQQVAEVSQSTQELDDANIPSSKVDLVINGGYLLDMVDDDGNPVPIKGISIDDGRISGIYAENTRMELPEAKRTIDATGNYILPGLVDVHVHFRPWTPSAAIWRRGHLYYGVTTIQDFSPCGSGCKVEDPNEWLLAYKDLVNNSAISAGPTLYIAGKKLNGPDAESEAHGHNLESSDDVVPYIDYLLDLGIDFITVEDELPPDFLEIALAEGAKRGVPVAGHAKDAEKAIKLGQKFIEHMYPITHSSLDNPGPENFSSPDYDYLMDMNKLEEMINLLLINDVYLNPTMTSRYGRLSTRAETFTREDEESFQFGEIYSDTPEEYRKKVLAAYKQPASIGEGKLQKLQTGFEKIQTFIREFTEVGGKVLAGTDTTDAKVPGRTMHRELDMLVDAGITPYRALLGATRWPAEYLYKDNIIGTIESGKEADILILESNPLEDITNSRDIQYVIHSGSVQRSPDDCSVIEPPISRTCWE